MKSSRQKTLATLCLITLGGCTPISPSVHKSSLRPGEPSQTPPKVEAPAGSVPIEVRWINSEENLNAALSGSTSSMVIRLPSSSLERLRTEGVLSVDLPSDMHPKTLEKARILLRVQLPSEELERALALETWSFEWEQSTPSSLEIRSSYAKKSGEATLLPDSLVSVHVVLQDDPGATSSP
ncbi:MAG: hypothetical protein KGQ59_07020 [Bdellovibrionales bacterium]|nr:hypothetical protein [Bdellovibrionales bacterium]